MLVAVGILLVVLLTAATGYFVAQEFAYVSVDRTRLRQLADTGDPAAQRALDITGRLSFTLSGAQFGITVTALLVGYAGEPLIGTQLAEWLALTGLGYAASLTLSVVLVLVFSTVLQMVLGELAPKNLAIARPVPLALSLSASTTVYLRIAGPVIRLFDSASNRLLRLVGIEPVEELAPGATTEDLEHVIDESRRGGVLDEELSALLDRGLALRTLTADEAMTPRVAVDTVRATDTLADVATLLRTSTHSRFPVVADDVDDVVGVVGVAELLETDRDRWASTTVRRTCATPLVLPGSVPLPAALEQLRAGRRQLAVVVDEFGGFDGVLSLEDIAEEVVGDIFDEGDTPPTEPDTAVAEAGAVGANAHTLSARLRLDEVEDLLGWRLPEGPDYATLSGLVLWRLGRVTQVGDTVVVDEVLDPADLDEDTPRHEVVVRVDEVERHVPALVTVSRREIAQPVEQELPLVSPALSITLSVLLLVLNGFFVAAEFAVVSAKRHRLEVAAAYGGRAARAAVRNSRELSLGLAGAQLGITLATLGLGALAKPAVADLLEPLFLLAPVPDAVAAAVATVLAVAVVVFLHMVVGEMAPKSWAISHPERSSILLALPFRAFMASTRWLLRALNAVANRLLRIWDVDPVDETSVAQGPAELQLLIDTSREHGLIEAADERLLSGVLDLTGTPVYAVTLPIADVVTVPATGTAGDVAAQARTSGRSRIVVLREDGVPSGLVHVRDALLADAGTPVRDLVYGTTRLDPHDTVLDAIGRMRADRSQLALVGATNPDESGPVMGITALEDLLERVLGEFEDERDRT